MTEWLGQNGEDRIIAAYLAEHHPTLVGRVLDIGAHDGWSLSNTARLLERGWGGTLVEASPRPLAKLIDRWGDREDIEIVGACVVTDAQYRDGGCGLVEFYDDAGAACHGGEAYLGTTEAANVAKWTPHTKFRRVQLASVTCSDVLYARLNAAGLTRSAPWGMWSIDVEGTSVEILRDLSAALWSYLAAGAESSVPAVVVVEHDDLHAQIAEWCATYGYRVLECNAENVIAVRA